ncbi:MAG TPA: M48 family metallopeptidase [Gammaproteobacteria bacterium]|nr:M48 family metallopeptidase [Gammaproteobacteria bacterium]
MPPLTIAFLAALALYLTLKIWLARRQLHHVHAHRDEIPAAFDGAIQPDQHRKAADYTTARVRLGLVDLGVSTVLLLLWTLIGGLGWLDVGWRHLGLNQYLTGTGVILSVILVSALIDLPLSIYSTFGLEARFGFNKTTPGTFVGDLIKSMVLLLIIGAPLIFCALWLMARAGALWWLYVWALWLAFTLVMTWAYPALIAPLFNKFRPLDNAELKERLTALLARCGFSSEGVFVMDGSRRSAHGNAYFTGFGRNKRIVFFDTLMDTLDDVEIEAVMAHELGHFRLHHIKLRLVMFAVLGLAGFALLGWLAAQPWFYHGLGVPTPSDHAALILFALVAPIFMFPLTPAFSWLSRGHEFAADNYATRQAAASALVSGLVKLYRDNSTTLTPDPIYSKFYDSHPPATVRIANLRQVSSTHIP